MRISVILTWFLSLFRPLRSLNIHSTCTKWQEATKYGLDADVTSMVEQTALLIQVIVGDVLVRIDQFKNRDVLIPAHEHIRIAMAFAAFMFPNLRLENPLISGNVSSLHFAVSNSFLTRTVYSDIPSGVYELLTTDFPALFICG